MSFVRLSAARIFRSQHSNLFEPNALLDHAASKGRIHIRNVALL